MKYGRPALGVALLALAASGDALANMGIPMLAIAWPALWLSFVPVVLIEACFLKRMIGVTFGNATKAMLYANMVSTLVGVPLVWGMLLAIEFAIGSTLLSGELTSKASIVAMTIIGAPWIGGGGETSLDVAVAFAILAVWFCLASILVEHRVLRRRFEGFAYNAILRCVAIANVTTYAVITVLVANFFLFWNS